MANDNAEKRTPSWDDKLKDALPQNAKYFDGLRTDAYTNHNLVDNYVEWWAAFKVDKTNDKWRLMHFMVSNLSQADGHFTAERASKEDVSFLEAVSFLARAEYRAVNMITHAGAQLEEKYPADRHPELKEHYYRLDYYRPAANIEGIVFDEFNDPHRRVEGKIFSSATFMRSEVSKASLAIYEVKSENARNRIEAGILSDIFNETSQRSATLDNILKVGEVLSEMDQFALKIGAFYLGVQQALSLSPTLDKVALPAADRARLSAQAADILGRSGKNEEIYDQLTNYILPSAEESLDKARQLGVHTEPFKKFLSECEVYMHMLNATQKLPILEKGLVSASTADISLITDIKQSIFLAQKKFLELGGTETQMDKIKAWIANPDKDIVPGWLPGFLSRYYETRGNVMQRVQERKAGPKEVKLMTTEVKPPIQQESVEDQNASVAQPAAESLDVNKYKNVTGGNGPKI